MSRISITNIKQTNQDRTMKQTSPNQNNRIFYLPLGCPKNSIDGEVMLKTLTDRGYTLAHTADQCDGVLVNTCGFIESAKNEAIENILELAELKREGAIKVIVAAGCMTERYKDDFLKELPEVDAIIGAHAYGDVAKVFDAAFAGRPVNALCDINASVEERERLVTTPPFTAYVKISEGCDNHCAYCCIPMIRGRLRSRTMENIEAECRKLAGSGAKELILVAQDTTAYGTDIYGKPSLTPLLRRLCRIDRLEWLRIHYMYPQGIDDELIECIAKNPKIVRYLDIPIQHFDDGILKSMNRRYTGGKALALIEKLRRCIPGVVLRTSLIAGLPGEGENEFETLCAAVRRAGFERAGVFAYSPEEGTAAASLPNQVEPEERERRREQLALICMETQEAYQEAQAGRTVRVLCEGYDRLAGCFAGRTFADSPDIDGKVFFTADAETSPGDMIDILVEELMDCDLVGKRIG